MINMTGQSVNWFIRAPIKKDFYFIDNVTIIHRLKLTIMADLRPIVPSCMYQTIYTNISISFVYLLVVVQEEGSRKVLVYLNIPELRVKRSFPNFLKQIPLNGTQKTLDFQNQ